MTSIIGSYNICNGSDVLSKILPTVLRLIAVSVYTMAIDSGSIVAENNDACMFFTLKYLFIAILKFVCLYSAHGTFLIELD